VQVERIDERRVADEREGGNFVVFIYEGGDEGFRSWSVDSYLLTHADLAGVFAWLGDNLPVGCCWSLGVVKQPERPTEDTDVTLSWVVGGDVLNISSTTREPGEQRLAEEMLRRRHRLTLT